MAKRNECRCTKLKEEIHLSGERFLIKLAASLTFMATIFSGRGSCGNDDGGGQRGRRGSGQAG